MTILTGDVPRGAGFWVLKLDSCIFSVLLGVIFAGLFWNVARKASAAHPTQGQNLIEMIVEFVQGQVNEIFPHANSLIAPLALTIRSEEHTSELQSLMRISYAVFRLKKKNTTQTQQMNKNKKTR